MGNKEQGDDGECGDALCIKYVEETGNEDECDNTGQGRGRGLEGMDDSFMDSKIRRKPEKIGRSSCRSMRMERRVKTTRIGTGRPVCRKENVYLGSKESRIQLMGRRYIGLRGIFGMRSERPWKDRPPESPPLERLNILRMSSTSPTIPRAAVPATATSTLLPLGSDLPNDATRPINRPHGTTKMPPAVGVPVLARWDSGPFARTVCEALRRRSSGINAAPAPAVSTAAAAIGAASSLLLPLPWRHERSPESVAKAARKQAAATVQATSRATTSARSLSANRLFSCSLPSDVATTFALLALAGGDVGHKGVLFGPALLQPQLFFPKLFTAALAPIEAVRTERCGGGRYTLLRTFENALLCPNGKQVMAGVAMGDD